MVDRRTPLTRYRVIARALGEPQATKNPAGQPIPADLPHEAVLYSLGLKLPDDLIVEQWREIGTILAKRSTGLQWALGDWWAYGDFRYGERATAAADLLPYAFQTLMNFASVARQIETSRRREDVSYSHHAEVASLPPDAQETWLASAVEHEWTVRQLRQEIDRFYDTDVDTAQDQARRMSDWIRRQAQMALRWDEDDPRFDHLSMGDLEDFLGDMIQEAEALNAKLERLSKRMNDRRAQGASFRPRPIRPPHLAERQQESGYSVDGEWHDLRDYHKEEFDA